MFKGLLYFTVMLLLEDLNMYEGSYVNFGKSDFISGCLLLSIQAQLLFSQCGTTWHFLVCW